MLTPYHPAPVGCFRTQPSGVRSRAASFRFALKPVLAALATLFMLTDASALSFAIVSDSTSA